MQKKPHEIPTDAIILTEQQALQYQFRIIDNWSPGNDV